ncbi:Fc.00g049980.m01.CDS01 [Cosmosporella sp. VM-42]
MSPNIQESEATSRKRSHDEFAGDAIKPEGGQDDKPVVVSTPQPTGEFLLTSNVDDAPDSSPLSSPGLTDPGSSTPVRRSPSPATPSKTAASKSSTKAPKPTALTSTTAQSSSSTTNPPAKRKRLTAAEKEEEARVKAEKKKEREDAAAAKAAEKAKAEEEKAAKAKEREEKRKEKEGEARVKAEQREEKKRKKEEEQQKIKEEKDRKARSQKTLNNFFNLGTPKQGDDSSSKVDSPKNGRPVKATQNASKTHYEKLFKPFFVKNNTKLAQLGPQMDDETRDVKSRILDEYMSGKRDDAAEAVPFDAVSLFAFPIKPQKRGKLHHPVRHIMEQVYKESEKSENADHARKLINQARQKLTKVPMKVIAFSQDVRPPYYGTMTFKSFALGLNNMSQLARKPTGRRLPLDYDYDSEAEWQEEEGEDLDGEDDEEELDDEDDMEGFLDDSEDAGLSRRIFANTLEPDSTGICFEDDHRQGPSQIVYEHKMEFIHEGLQQSWGIDPFSTQYWEPEPKPKISKATQAGEAKVKAKMAPPPAPVNAFAALAAGASGTNSLKLVNSDILNDVKQAILDNKSLSKVGIVDVVFQRFRDSVSRMEVKNTIEHVAEKQGTGRQKTWALKPGHEIVS